MRIKLIALFFLLSGLTVSAQQNQKTIINPMNISYRFTLDQPSRREAADPVILLFKDKYYLFASKSGGYWYSDDLADWKFVTTKDLPLENYAPAATAIGDYVYYMGSTSPLPKTQIYRSSDPVSGKWELYNDSFPISMTDPDIFVDTDGKIYFYYGCSNRDPLLAVELDVNNKLNPKGTPVTVFGGNPLLHGWEQTGDYGNSPENPWIEGSWMTKYNGKYYLQYAGPGTQYKSYADGVYVSDKPLGPFTYQKNNPFSSRPEGFIAAAGHGATFADKYGNYWHIATMTISVKHMFERRLGLFPTGFDNDGTLRTYTGFGDYPFVLPTGKFKSPDELLKGWMLLSYRKDAAESSQDIAHPAEYAFDEDIRTFWSASSGRKGEWLSVDLVTPCTVNAIQINFAENGTTNLGRDNVLCHQYIIEYSTNRTEWKVLIDKSNATEDLTHQYEVLQTPVTARYLRIKNQRVPSGMFAISDFRVFGKGTGSQPAAVTTFKAERDPEDTRVVRLSWNDVKGATGYNIRFGVEKDKLYHDYQLNGRSSITIRSLDKGVPYWFVIDSYNENGITKGTTPVLVK